MLTQIRRNPVATRVVAVVAVAVVVGVIGWVAGGRDNAPKPVDADPPREVMVVAAAASMAPPELTEPQYRAVPADLLPKLKPGMTRVQVEQVIGSPFPSSLEPLTVSAGRATYRAAYELAEPDAPATVRPIHRVRIPHPQPQAEPKSLVALEFDASKPGHPLISLVYLDPLF